MAHSLQRSRIAIPIQLDKTAANLTNDQPPMRPRPYQICSNCVMDTTDSAIVFDEDGVCDHCNDFRKHVAPAWHPDEQSRLALEHMAEKIRTKSKGLEFDCILGLSGGLDSSYMLHLLVKELGLRPLVFHVDAGWNTDLAVSNIQSLVEALSLDLYTEVINWEDMRDFQLAYFKSGLPGIDIPQDHAFVATLYHFANKHNVKYIMNGGNISTECVRNPLEWLYYGTDMAQINDIRRRYCTRDLKDFPFSSVLFHKVYLRYIRQVRVVKPLNLLPYIKSDAEQVLAKAYGWRAYPQKHFESRFTKFIEGYWLPTRFGFDTRRVQFSSLILTGQMSRSDAIDRLSRPSFSESEIESEFEYISRKLGISVGELTAYHKMPLKSYRDYKNHSSLFDLGARALKAIGVESAIKR